MAIDISNLTASELDELITDATKKRERLTPEVSQDWPKGEMQAIRDPRFAFTAIAEGTLLQIRHPGHGWLNIVLTPLARSFVVAYLMQNAIAPPISKDAPVQPPTSMGGATVH